MNLDMDKIKAAIQNMSQEDIDKYFPEDTTPKGWVSIEEHLPKFRAMDIAKGGSEYKIKFEDGSEVSTLVSDHTMWYYMAKDAGVTHWWND